MLDVCKSKNQTFITLTVTMPKEKLLLSRLLKVGMMVKDNPFGAGGVKPIPGPVKSNTGSPKPRCSFRAAFLAGPFSDA